MLHSVSRTPPAPPTRARSWRRAPARSPLWRQGGQGSPRGTGGAPLAACWPLRATACSTPPLRQPPPPPPQRRYATWAPLTSAAAPPGPTCGAPRCCSSGATAVPLLRSGAAVRRSHPTGAPRSQSHCATCCHRRRLRPPCTPGARPAPPRVLTAAVHMAAVDLGRRLQGVRWSLQLQTTRCPSRRASARTRAARRTAHARARYSSA